MTSAVPGPGSSDASTPSIPPQVQSLLSNFSAESQDPWAKMLGPMATPQQVKQFKEAVIRALNSQMQQERDQMTKALRRMRKEEE
jgi:hypothetical protein